MKAPVAVALTLLLLLGSVSLGLRRSPFDLLNPFGRSPVLDYSVGPQGIVPLDARYVASVLGERARAQASARGRPPSSAAAVSAGFEPPERITDVHPLTNDRRARARPIPAVPFTARTNTSDAGREPREPTSCSRSGGTVWYRYDPDSDIGLIANTFGTNYSTTLGIFSESGDGLMALGCDSDGGGNAVHQFAAKKGTVYLFQIAGTAGGGNLVFNLDPQGTTTLASAAPDGGPAGRWSQKPSLSADGRIVAFRTVAGEFGSDDLPCITRERSGTGGVNTSITSPDDPCSQVAVLDRTTGEAAIVSVNHDGRLSNGHVYSGPAVSGDGRYISYASSASNLVADDSNEVGDVFVHDLLKGTTERASVTSDERQVSYGPLKALPPAYEGTPFEVEISHDGRFVAFSTSARLVPEDGNDEYDIYVRDRRLGTTSRVSISSGGDEATGLSSQPCLSADGRYVAFTSGADNLVPGDTNGQSDVFVHDRVTGRTTLQSSAPGGAPARGYSETSRSFNGPGSCMSGDGRFVVFRSSAPNLVRGDTNGIEDVFVRDRSAATTTRVSVSSSGEQGEESLQGTPQIARELPKNVYNVLRQGLVNSNTGTDQTQSFAVLSMDGRFAAFSSFADNLVPEDTNGTVDVFVHDLVRSTTIRVSVNARGEAFAGDSSSPAISADGRFIAFDSSPQLADPLRGSLEAVQVYVHERAGAVR